MGQQMGIDNYYNEEKEEDHPQSERNKFLTTNMEERKLERANWCKG